MTDTYDHPGTPRSTCRAAIRPFTDETEIRCEKIARHTAVDSTHAGRVRDYAYPGSETKVDWEELDRRNFYGDWPGPCDLVEGCTLPLTHPGRCAL